MRLIIGLIGVSLVFFIGWRLIRRLLFVERQNANAAAAHDYFNHLRTNQKLIPIESSILLMPEEVALFEGAADLCEKKPQLIYQNRVFMSPSDDAPADKPKLNVLQAGVLVLTNKRLVFVNWLESRSLRLEDIGAAKAWVDSIELTFRPSPSSEFYRVENPIIWSSLIEALTAGSLQGFIERGLAARIAK